MADIKCNRKAAVLEKLGQKENIHINFVENKIILFLPNNIIQLLQEKQYRSYHVEIQYVTI